MFVLGRGYVPVSVSLIGMWRFRKSEDTAVPSPQIDYVCMIDDVAMKVEAMCDDDAVTMMI